MFKQVTAFLMILLATLATGCTTSTGDGGAPAADESPAAAPQAATGQSQPEQPGQGGGQETPAAPAEGVTEPDRVAQKFIYAMLVGDLGMMHKLQAPDIIWGGAAAEQFLAAAGQPRAPVIVAVPELEETQPLRPGDTSVAYRVRFVVDYGSGPQAYQTALRLVADAAGAWRVQGIEVNQRE